MKNSLSANDVHINIPGMFMKEHRGAISINNSLVLTYVEHSIFFLEIWVIFSLSDMFQERRYLFPYH